MHPIRKLTPCKIRSVRHSAEKLSAISQSSSVLPVTRISGFRYLEMTAIFQTIALIWKTVFYLNYPYVYLWNACFSVACSWWLCQLLSDMIWTLYFRVKFLEYLFMRCHNHLCQNMVIFQGKSQCVFSFCAYFALFMILNPCQKKECNICSMPARASGAYKSSSRWKRSDAEIRQGIQCSYGVVFLYTVVLGGEVILYIMYYKKWWDSSDAQNKAWIFSTKTVTIISSAFSLIHVHIWKNMFILRGSSESLDLLFA